MTLEELEELAFQGAPMPDLTSQAQVLLYLSFRSLYDFARRVQMNPDQGRKEKRQILKAYEVNRFLEELQENTNEMWKRIDLASVAYRKAPSIKNADALLEAIYRVPRKEKGN